MILFYLLFSNLADYPYIALSSCISTYVIFICHTILCIKMAFYSKRDILECGFEIYCILFLMKLGWNMLLGLLPIFLIAADIRRAFKKGKHWIPSVSLVLSSITLQLMMLLNTSLGVSEARDKDSKTWLGPLAGRVSVCVFMGCLLPAVSTPLSPTMWTNMAALMLTTGTCVLQIALDLYDILKHNYSEIGFSKSNVVAPLIVGGNLTILVSIVVVVVLLNCAVVASVGIHQSVCRKIPITLSSKKFNHRFSWEKVEEHMIKSVLVVHSYSPQYILARSILTAPIALFVAVCNGILIRVSLFGMPLSKNIEICLVYPFIILGSGVIFWRCITATIYYPRKIVSNWSSIKQYFKIENFWLTYLEELDGWALRDEGMGRNSFRKLMNKLWRSIVLHRSLRILIGMQKFSVLFSKACWLVLQLLLSNNFMERVVMRSGSQEFSSLNREKHQPTIVLGTAVSGFDKYCETLLQLPGEGPAGIWIANKKYVEDITKHIKKGQEEANKCNELMLLLKHKSSSDFSGEKHVKPHQNYLVIRLEVERDLDVCKPSFKMAVVSLVTIMVELASFIPNSSHNDLINKAIEACYQAWNIMDIVDNSDTEAAMVSKSADKLFQDLQKSRKWLGYHLPLSKGVGNSVEAAKAGIQNLVEKAKQMAVDYKSRKWEEVAAGYRLYWLSLNINYQQMTSVEEIVDKMCSELADVVASCTVKAVGVGVNGCKKWAAKFDEESILKAAHVVGKVRTLMENVDWELKCSFNSDTQSVETWVERARNGKLLRKYATFQTAPIT